ncbi:MAG: flagellar brake protein [Methylobacter sp.]|nr:MAG: flagellar brake protein [Methylobacter sp.]
MSNTSSFSIQNPKQIISHLSLLFKNKCLLSARLEANNESYITTLLGIHEENNALVLDYGSKEDLNKHIVNANKLRFETEYRGIKVSFVGSALRKVNYKGEPAFVMPIPKSLFWMQRREFFRVKSPPSKPSYCRLILEDKNPVNLKLHDISLTGFAILNVSKEISDLLIPGRSFAQCKLIFSRTEESEIAFEIRYKYIINHAVSQKIQKIGCKFTKITHSAEDTIQRNMHQIQREYLQKDNHLY